MKRHNEFYNPAIETIGQDELRDIQLKKLMKELHYVNSYSPFYSKKFKDAGIEISDIRSLGDLSLIPFTSKAELRESLDMHPPLGLHQAAPMDDIIRIHSSTGTTGKPTFIGITDHDRSVWMEIVARALFAQGFRRNSIVIHALGLSFFVGGLPVKDSAEKIGATFVPIGTGASDRVLNAIEHLRADVLHCTPSYVIYLAEYAQKKGIDPGKLGIKKLACGAEPGGGVPAIKAKMQELWNATAQEGCGNADMAPIIFAECDEQQGMHFCAQEFVICEIIDPNTGETIEMRDGAEGELVYTAIDRECCPLIRFRTRDHIRVWTSPCPCGRTSFRIRCVGRTDDMLILRGVNVFPSAIRDVVAGFRPKTTGEIQIQLFEPGPAVSPPLNIKVEYAEGAGDLGVLKKDIENSIREKLVFSSNIELVPAYSLPRFEMKAQLIRKLYEE